MKAFQLIYSNVLPEQSPWGKRRHETLTGVFYTPLWRRLKRRVDPKGDE
jgi:hypothetical protein